MIYGYCRVSTDKQDVEKYVDQLKTEGIAEENIFKDVSFNNVKFNK